MRAVVRHDSNERLIVSAKLDAANHRVVDRGGHYWLDMIVVSGCREGEEVHYGIFGGAHNKALGGVDVDCVYCPRMCSDFRLYLAAFDIVYPQMPAGISRHAQWAGNSQSVASRTFTWEEVQLASTARGADIPHYNIGFLVRAAETAGWLADQNGMIVVTRACEIADCIFMFAKSLEERKLVTIQRVDQNTAVHATNVYF